MSQCKSCGADILWAVNEITEARIPLSVRSKEKRFILLDNDNVRMVETYLSHFADCPDADKFRKRK